MGFGEALNGNCRNGNFRFPIVRKTGAYPLLVIMKATLKYMKSLVPDSIDQPMLIVNLAAPAPSVIAFEWLRFPNTFERISKRIPNELVDAYQHFLICSLPIDILFPCKGLKYLYKGIQSFQLQRKYRKTPGLYSVGEDTVHLKGI